MKVSVKSTANNDGLVSIIVPLYNLSDYIENCLNSLISQSYSNIEIIVVDDESKDNSFEIVKKLASVDKRVKCVAQKNGGAAKARNKGLGLAKGEYIMFIDGDDMLAPCTIENTMQQFKKYFLLDWIAFSIIRTNEKGERISNNAIYGDYIIEEDRVVLAEQVVPYFFDGTLSGLCCGMIIKRDVIKNLSFPEGEYYEDSMFYTDILCVTKKGLLSSLGQYYYVHREHSSQLTTMSRKHLISSYKSRVKRLTQFAQKYPQYKELYINRQTADFYFFKLQKAKRMDGAAYCYELFKREFSTHKISVKMEIKIFLYNLLGYNNVKRLFYMLRL